MKNFYYGVGMIVVQVAASVVLIIGTMVVYSRFNTPRTGRWDVNR